MFGMKAAAKRRDVTQWANMMLALQYKMWLAKKPPHGLVDGLVKTTLDPNPVRLAGGAMLDVHAVVGALDALLYGSKAIYVPPEDQTMCARAVMELVLFTNKNPPPRFTHNDKFMLNDTAKSALEDPEFMATSENKTPAMWKNHAAWTVRALAK